jgi:1,2-diacylglycerol 3-alpha-glucosyltransferase
MEVKKYEPKKLMDLALFYCSRRETSRSRLETYLLKKVDLKAQPDAREWIDEILKELERLNVINHRRYAEILNREYVRRGKGKRYIEKKLSEKGLKEEISQLEFSDELELERAISAAAKASQKSTILKAENDFARKQKLLQKLVSLGFEFSIAKKAIEEVLKQ